MNRSFDFLTAQEEAGTIVKHTGTWRDVSQFSIYSFIKRMLDIFLSIVGIFLTLPVWLCIALLIKLSGRGPVFFTQIRAGLNGKPFRMYKFRSMVLDAEDRLNDLIDIDNLEEPVFKIKNDPRVTMVGRILRRTSLDELPQIINVLKGEMSLIGPRPEELRIVEKYNGYQRVRLKTKPGITGYQQIMNRGESSFSRRFYYDLIYLNNQNLFMDFYIVFMTVPVVLLGKGTTH